MTITAILLGSYAAVALFGVVGLRFGADSRPGFDERTDARHAAFEPTRQIPGIS